MAGPQTARQFIFLLWPLQFYEANGWEIWVQWGKKAGQVRFLCIAHVVWATL